MKEKRDGGAAAILLFMFLLGLFGVLSPFFLPKPAKLVVILRDEIFNTSLSGKSAVLIDERYNEIFHRTIFHLDGDDVVSLEHILSGQLTLRLFIDGYTPTTINIDIRPLEIGHVTTSLMPNFGRIRVSIVNAETNQTVSKAYFHVDTNDEALVVESTLFLPGGDHRLRAYAPGFCATEVPVFIDTAKNHWIKIALSEDLKPGQSARLILSWANELRLDLDAHVYLKDSSVEIDDPHVYFGKRHGFVKSDGRFAELHADYQRTESFETITIFGHGPGTYHYYVNLFSEGSTLQQSNVRIEVFSKRCERRVYNPPPICTEPWWAAVDLIISNKTVNIFEEGQCPDKGPEGWQAQFKPGSTFHSNVR